jgi:hypothetical protein
MIEVSKVNVIVFAKLAQLNSEALKELPPL